MAERENGFYWVKNGLDWVVAEWFGDQWFMAGSEVDEPSGAFAQVGPRLTPPGEPDPIHVLFRRLVFECDFVDTTGHMDKILAEAKKLGFDGKRP